MSAEIKGQYSQLEQLYKFRPMQIDDLDAIMKIEPQIYPHPWTRGNFSDSISSGYSASVLLHDDKIIMMKSIGIIYFICQANYLSKSCNVFLILIISLFHF